ncbi:hypothetical protein ACHAXR_003130 [Thalassiosira sp. AJA248-18]
MSSNPSSPLTFSGEEPPAGSDLEPPAGTHVVSKTSRRSSIQFDTNVSAVNVPSHRSYSPELRAQLHVSKEELSYNTIRNTREFIYEGWDWRNVVEEDMMYTCGASGEYVHPAHVGRTKRVNPYL